MFLQAQSGVGPKRVARKDINMNQNNLQKRQKETPVNATNEQQGIPQGYLDYIEATIPENEKISTPKKPKSKGGKKGKKKKILTVESSVRTLNIKIYDEQIMGRFSNLYIWAEFIKTLPINQTGLKIVAMIHDKDFKTDDPFAPTGDKRHAQIVVKTANGKPTKVGTILNTLGIYFRPDKDKKLWEGSGVETCIHYQNSVLYLIHGTKKAISDGKYFYDPKTLITNMCEKELQEILKQANHSQNAKSDDTYRNLEFQAYNWGYYLRDWEEFLSSLDYTIRKKTVDMNLVETAYYKGANARLELHEEVNKKCIFIQGAANTGKTYAVKKALKQLDKKTIVIDGGGTGLMDNLLLSHQAIVVNDYKLPNLINMSDNIMSRVYRRNSNNPIFTGDYLVITANKSLQEYAQELGYKDENVRAIMSRFYECIVQPCPINPEVNWVKPIRLSTRGTKDFLLKKHQDVERFLSIVNDIMMDYYPEQQGAIEYDLSDHLLKKAAAKFAPKNKKILPF